MQLTLNITQFIYFGQTSNNIYVDNLIIRSDIKFNPYVFYYYNS